MSDLKYTRITISIPQKIVDWVDKEAKKQERSRSWMLSKMAEEIIKMKESENPPNMASGGVRVPKSGTD